MTTPTREESQASWLEGVRKVSSVSPQKKPPSRKLSYREKLDKLEKQLKIHSDKVAAVKAKIEALKK